MCSGTGGVEEEVEENEGGRSGKIKGREREKKKMIYAVSSSVSK